MYQIKVILSGAKGWGQHMEAKVTRGQVKSWHSRPSTKDGPKPAGVFNQSFITCFQPKMWPPVDLKVYLSH